MSGVAADWLCPSDSRQHRGRQLAVYRVVAARGLGLEVCRIRWPDRPDTVVTADYPRLSLDDAAWLCRWYRQVAREQGGLCRVSKVWRLVMRGTS